MTLEPDARSHETSANGTPISPEQRDRVVGRIVVEAIWVREFATDLITWTGSATGVFGYGPEDETAHVRTWFDRIHPDDRPRLEDTIRRALSSGAQGWSCEYRIRRKDGSWAWAAGRTLIERDAAGRPVRSVGAMIDVGHLRQTLDWLRLFTEQVPARACATDTGLRVLWDVGAGFSDNPLVVGKTVEELFATSPDRERVLAGCRQALAGESCNLNIDDGTSAAHLQLVPLRDTGGHVIGVVGLALDVTERVRAEQQLHDKQERLQSLSRRLLAAQESERRAIARELHDDLGAMLSALKLNLQKKDEGAAEARAESIALVDQVVQRVRDLASDLRPAILDDLGLAEAVRWYAGRETRRAGLELALDVEPVEGDVPVHVKTACFRICQEALTNVIRHAGARRVTIRLRASDGTIRLGVRDDGRGFDAAGTATQPSNGLVNMQERAALAGGMVVIDSAPGRGTEVRAALPLAPEPEP